MKVATVINQIDSFDIIQTKDGIFRFVNHKQGMLTTGFGGKDETNLLKYKYCIRFDVKTTELMKNRYKIAEVFGEFKNK